MLFRSLAGHTQTLDASKVEEVLSFHTLTGFGAVRPFSGTSQVFRNPETPSDSRTTPEWEVATGFFRVENLLDRTNVAPRARGLGFSLRILRRILRRKM
jgi:hypothetical protein